jgi:hypothetical protein
MLLVSPISHFRHIISSIGQENMDVNDDFVSCIGLYFIVLEYFGTRLSQCKQFSYLGSNTGRSTCLVLTTTLG